MNVAIVAAILGTFALVVELAGIIYVFSYFDVAFSRGPHPRFWALVTSTLLGVPLLGMRLVDLARGRSRAAT